MMKIGQRNITFYSAILTMIIAATLGGSVGCSTKKTEAVRHSGPRSTEAMALGEKDVDASSQSMGDAERVRASQVLESAKTVEEIVAQLETMSGAIFNEELILNPKKDKEGVASDLQIFNQLILRAISMNKPNAKLDKILKIYEELLMKGIEQNQWAYLKYFSRGPLSAEVLGRIVEKRWAGGKARSESDIIRDYRHLQYALHALGNNNESPLLFNLYFKRSLEYTEALQKASLVNKAELTEKHIHILFDVLEQINRTLTANCAIDAKAHKVTCSSPRDAALYKDFEEFIESSNIWTKAVGYSETFEAIRGRLMKIAVRFMYDSRGQLRKSLQQAITNSQTAPDSLYQKLLRAKNRLGRAALLEMGFDTDKYLTGSDQLKSQYLNIVFYTLNSLYNESLDADTATEIWVNTQVENKEQLLLDSADVLIYVTLIDLILETNDRLRGVMLNEKLLMRTKKDYLDEVFFEGSNVRDIWSARTAKLDTVTNLISRFMQRADLTRQKEQYNHIENIKGNLKKNIVLSAVMPNQFLLAYMVTHNADVNLLQSLSNSVKDMFGTSLSFSHNDMANRTFDGWKFLPWFDFNNGKAEVFEFTKWESLYIYIYASAMQVFRPITQEQTQKADKSLAGVDIVQFADFFIKTLLENEKTYLRLESQKINTFLTSTDYRDFRGMCNKLRNESHRWNTPRAEDADLRLLEGESLEFAALPVTALIGRDIVQEDSVIDIRKSPPPLYKVMSDVIIPAANTSDYSVVQSTSATHKLGTAIMRASTLTKYQMQYLQTWLDFMEIYYKNVNSNELPQIEIKFVGIKARIAEFKRHLAGVHTLLKLSFGELSSCLETIESYEKRVQDRVRTHDVQVLRELYRHFEHNAKAASDSAFKPNSPFGRYKQITDELAKDPAMKNITVQNEIYVDEQAQVLNLTKFGALLSIRQHIMEVTGASMPLPPAIENQEIYTLGKTSTKKTTFKGNSEDDFIASVMTYQFGEASPVTRWIHSFSAREKILTMASRLYKMASVTYLSGEKCTRNVILSERLLTDKEACQPTEGYLVSYNGLIDETIRFAKPFHIDGDEYKYFFKYTGRASQSKEENVTKLRNMFIDQNKNEQLSFLATTYQNLFEIAKPEAPLRDSTYNRTPLADALEFYRSMNSATAIIFRKPNDPYLTMMKSSYRNYLRKYMTHFLDFECGVGYRSYRDRKAPLEVVYARDPRDENTGRSLGVDADGQRANYLNPEVIRNQESQRIQIFNTIAKFYNEGVPPEGALTAKDFLSPYESCYQKCVTTEGHAEQPADCRLAEAQ